LNWKEVDRVYRQFTRADTNNSGTISYSEMAVVFNKVVPDLPENEYSRVFNNIDANNSGFVDFIEYLSLLLLYKYV
jgi:Ca2+-binding EF-hand superfamily protein